MKKWKIAAAAACVCFLFTVAYAANAGGANDPLVTLSYLNTTFSKQVQGMVDQTVDQRRAEMEDALAKVLEQGGTGTAGGNVFSVVTLSQGQTLVGDVGCEVMLRIGSAVCGSTDSVGLIDTTTGANLSSGGGLATNHLYMVTISTRSVTATSGTVKVLARGPYTIR
ncbi:MAG: hypothetical protein K2P18_02780 [Oscillospiraceae bacterium]|nr:hypothetical protein [Oscillospiraceae bacterium]